jgi:hypothetical protein
MYRLLPDEIPVADMGIHVQYSQFCIKIYNSIELHTVSRRAVLNFDWFVVLFSLNKWIPEYYFHLGRRHPLQNVI